MDYARGRDESYVSAFDETGRVLFSIPLRALKPAEKRLLEKSKYHDVSMGCMKPYDLCEDCDTVKVEEVDVQYERVVPVGLKESVEIASKHDVCVEMKECDDEDS